MVRTILTTITIGIITSLVAGVLILVFTAHFSDPDPSDLKIKLITILPNSSEYECEKTKSCFEFPDETIKTDEEFAIMNADSITHSILFWNRLSGEIFPEERLIGQIMPNEIKKVVLPGLKESEIYCIIHPWVADHIDFR